MFFELLSTIGFINSVDNSERINKIEKRLSTSSSKKDKLSCQHNQKLIDYQAEIWKDGFDAYWKNCKL